MTSAVTTAWDWVTEVSERMHHRQVPCMKQADRGCDLCVWGFVTGVSERIHHRQVPCMKQADRGCVGLGHRGQREDPPSAGPLYETGRQGLCGAGSQGSARGFTIGRSLV